MENKVIKTIKSRVSCKSYSSKKVALSKVMQIVECGKNAPTAMNRQIANILVLRSKKYVENPIHFFIFLLHICKLNAIMKKSMA